MANNELLYIKMRNYLLELIERNTDVPDYRLPSEKQLAIKFGASRISAKHAYQTLCDEGKIIRQQGRGSFIAPAAQHTPSAPLDQAAACSALRGLADPEDAIALIVPFTSTIFMSDIMAGISEELAKRHLHYIIFLTDSDQKREAKYLRIAQECFKGILLFPSDFATYHEEVLRLVLNRFPLVQIDRYLPQLNLSYVACDHYGSTFRACHFLYQKGHRRIGFIGHLIAHASSVAERVRGYEDAMQTINPECAVSLKLNVDDSLQDFEAVFENYVSLRRPTAIISSSHLHAPAIMRVLKRMGKAQDVDLMLYDNEYVIAEEFMEFKPYIIDQQPRKIGRTAAELVYRLAFEGGAPQSIKLEEKLTQVGAEQSAEAR